MDLHPLPMDSTNAHLLGHSPSFNQPQTTLPMDFASHREPPPPQHRGNREVAPFVGYVETTVNALRLIHAARQGVIPRITRRLNDNERRMMIKSGSVFIFGVVESNIKRWTDGLLWSPSRIVGNFLVYREINERSGGRGSQRGKVGGQAQGVLSPNDPGVFKAGGLLKKTITVTIEGADLHLISYFLLEDVRSGKLKRPSTRPDIMSLPMDPQIFRLSNFRNPPKIEVGPNGKQRLICEAEDQDTSDCRTFNEPTFGNISSAKWSQDAPIDTYSPTSYYSSDSDPGPEGSDSSRWAARTYFKTESRDDHNLWLPPSPTTRTYPSDALRGTFGGGSARYGERYGAPPDRRDSTSTTYSNPSHFSSPPPEPGWSAPDWQSGSSAGAHGGDEIFDRTLSSRSHHSYLSPLMLPPSSSRDGRYPSSSGPQSQGDGGNVNDRVGSGSGTAISAPGRLATPWNLGPAAISEVRLSQRPMSSSSSHSQSYDTHTPPPSTTPASYAAPHSPSSASSSGGFESPASLHIPYQPMWPSNDSTDMYTPFGSQPVFNGERGHFVKQEEFEQYSPGGHYHKL